MTKKSDDRKISSFKTKMHRCQIQVQTSFRIFQIHFLISIILGMVFWLFTLGPNDDSLQRARIFKWTLLKFNRQKCKIGITYYAFNQILKKFLLFPIFFLKLSYYFILILICLLLLVELSFFISSSLIRRIDNAQFPTSIAVLSQWSG